MAPRHLKILSIVLVGSGICAGLFVLSPFFFALGSVEKPGVRLAANLTPSYAKPGVPSTIVPTTTRSGDQATGRPGGQTTTTQSGDQATGRPGGQTAGQASDRTVAPAVPSTPKTPVSILFLGDIMLDRTVATRMKKANDPLYPFAKIRNGLGQYFRGQDLVIANLEGPVTAVRRAPVKDIDFAFDPSVVKTLKKVGISAVSQANNHLLDQGRVGADESLRFLSQGGIAAFGDEVRDDLKSALAIQTVRGERFALLGFNATDHTPDRNVIAKDIVDAKATSSHVIVFIHWGTEYASKPNASQIELARWFVDQGVDAVIGSHPHWMQSVEVYKNRPIVYSLGNFVFDQDWSTETQFGLAVKLVFGEGSAAELRLYPISIKASQPQFMTGKDRDVRLNRLASVSDKSLSAQIKKGTIVIP
jgi:poly-gamma-glutamate capsule biosynthesis protein CapA/YwtB (metallophosphatase superfamily)